MISAAVHIKLTCKSFTKMNKGISRRLLNIHSLPATLSPGKRWKEMSLLDEYRNSQGHSGTQQQNSAKQPLPMPAKPRSRWGLRWPWIESIDTKFGKHVPINLGMDIYMPKNWTSGHREAFRGLLGGHQSKSLWRLSNGWTDWHQIWYTSADSSGNGHRLNSIYPSTFGEGG